MTHYRKLISCMLLLACMTGCQPQPQQNFQEGKALLEQGRTAAGLRKITTAADEKDPAAQYYLGVWLLAHFHDTKHEAKALYWIERAGTNNLADAEYLAGILRTRPQFKNWKKAVYWFKWAALKGNGDAAFQCALAYWHGYGCKSNLNTSLYWMEEAASEGNKEAALLAGVWQRKMQAELNRADSKRKTEKTGRIKNANNRGNQHNTPQHETTNTLPDQIHLPAATTPHTQQQNR